MADKADVLDQKKQRADNPTKADPALDATGVEVGKSKSKDGSVAPEGLTKDEEAAWRESLPEPAETPQDTRDLAHRVSDLEHSVHALKDFLNVDLAAEPKKNL